jgi:UDP-glucose 4-epimerase
MRVLVTGGAGFIASHIVDKLIELNYQVATIDNLSTGKEENINEQADFYKGDINDYKFLERIFQRFNPEIIIHHAAQSNARKSLDDPIYDCKTNIIGTLNLLDLSKDYGIKKFIYASSASIYGDVYKDISIREEDEIQPISFYAISKMTTEYYIQLYHKFYNINYIIFRYSNVYGPRQNPHGEGGVIPVFIDQMINDINPVIFGDGNQTRDFIYIEDVVNANIMAIEKDVNGIFNISTNTEININELFNEINNILHKDYKPKYGEMKKGDIVKSCLDNSKALEVLGWEPKHKIKIGLKRTIEYFLNEG